MGHTAGDDAAKLVFMLVAIALHTSYHDYIRGTHWLVALLGPATVAFAVPIYEQRRLIRRHWRVLGLGMLAGTATSMLSSRIERHHAAEPAAAFDQHTICHDDFR